MNDLVHINDATSRQLEVLLGADPAAVQKVLDGRPFASDDELRLAVPEIDPGRYHDLQVPLRDLNQESANGLARTLGITQRVARDIAKRKPYYLMVELQHVSGMTPDIFSLISELYAIPSFEYVDKLSGQSVGLNPDLSQLLVRVLPSDTESAADVIGSLRLTQLSSSSNSHTYQVFSTPETETGTSALRSLKDAPSIQEAVPAFRDQDRVSRFLDPEFCIVQFDRGSDEAAQQAIIDELGLAIETRHRSAGLVTLRVPGGVTEPGRLFQAIAALNARPEVTFAEPAYIGVNDLERAGEAGQTAEMALLPWNLNLIAAREAWQSSSGSENTVIALIDTGVDSSHPAIQGAFLPMAPDDDWNFESDASGTPDDSEGHGTFIAGLLVGNGELGIQGVCPGCKILPLKIPLAGSSLSYAQRRDAILHAVERTPAGSRLVINLSWKTTGDIALIRDAIATAIAAGAVVVCSAGNWPESENEPHFPSDYPSVISVAGVDPGSHRGVYSFYGANVTVSAPGGSGAEDQATNIVSAMPGGGTRADFGTSFAAPHVAGVIALLLSLNPDLTVPEVRQLLNSGAKPLDEPGMGSGLVDAAASLHLAASNLGAVPTEHPVPATLEFLNSASTEDLVARYGLKPLTAMIIEARRPYDAVTDIKGTLGLTDEQYQAIAGDEPGDHESGSLSSEEVEPLINVNMTTLIGLLSVPGMPRFTAEVILARRPIGSPTALQSIAGMTSAVMRHLQI